MFYCVIYYNLRIGFIDCIVYFDKMKFFFLNF